MAFNPFEQKPEKIEATVLNWNQLSTKPYNKNEVHPFTKLRIILLNGAEYEAVKYSHAFSRKCLDNDIRRDLALMRRVEQQQQKLISSLKPTDETILEQTIGYEQLAVELTCMLAEREKDLNVKSQLDFALLEDFDHLYRFANLLESDQKIYADSLLGNLTEVMPGRPTIAHHRHPSDTIKRWTDFNKAHPLTKLAVGIITAAEQQTMNYYMNVGAFYGGELGKKLFAEIAMVEEQHVTEYGGLTDPRLSFLECLLNHEYTECYLYYSAYQDETDKNIKKIYETCLIQEIAHLHKAAEMLKTYENKDWQTVIPNPEFPELLLFKSNKDYLRGVLRGTVNLTAEEEDYCEICELPKINNFEKWQKTVNSEIKNVPSHVVIEKYIKENKKDYRYQDKVHPIKELQNRREDNTNVGRICKK